MLSSQKKNPQKNPQDYKSKLYTHFTARLHLTRPITHSARLTHNNGTKTHIPLGASPTLHTNIKALLLGITIVLDGMIFHITYGTKFYSI